MPVTHKYVQKLHRRLEWGYEKVHGINGREIKHQKKHYDSNLRFSKLQLGDLVLVREKALKGKHKIQHRWENTPYQVVECIKLESTSLQGKQEGESARIHVLHHKMFFPLIITDECDVQSVSEYRSVDESDNNDSSYEQDYWSADEQPMYEGPMTWSRTKLKSLKRLKAKKLMDDYLETESVLVVKSLQPISICQKIFHSVQSILKTAWK